MNRIHCAGIALALAGISLAGCSTLVERTGTTPEADRVTVYEDSGPTRAQYRILKRLWTESWKSAFTVPLYVSADAGKADLQRQAVALGGDAVMNFGCYRLDTTIASGSGKALVCNGTVIKLVR